MSHPVLRLNDGVHDTSPEQRDEVKALQSELNKEGFSLDVDGEFGRDTEAAVNQVQRKHGLYDDGIVGHKATSFCKLPLLLIIVVKVMFLRRLIHREIWIFLPTAETILKTY